VLGTDVVEAARPSLPASRTSLSTSCGRSMCIWVMAASADVR
jgi:hypothetical protein